MMERSTRLPLLWTACVHLLIAISCGGRASAFTAKGYAPVSYPRHIHCGATTLPQAEPLAVEGIAEEESIIITGRRSDEEHQSSRLRDFRFASPLLEFGYPPAVEEFKQNLTSTKPLLVYLPGFDGTYLSAFFQYPELHTKFEVRCLVSTMDDRSTFDEMKDSVIHFILDEIDEAPQEDDGKASKSTNDKEGMSKDKGNPSKPTLFSGLLGLNKSQNKSKRKQANNKRPVYIAGESFGGILASEVARALLHEPHLTNLKGLVLINAATCYDRSRLAAEGPPVTRLPKLLYFFGLMKILPMFMDDVSLPQFLTIIRGEALPSVIDNSVREAYMGRLAFALPFMLKFMPQETLQWRLEHWLDTGCSRMSSQLGELAKHGSLRTLIVAGEKDLTLPSIAEAERLAQILPNSQVHVVDGAGHSSTCGSRVDLAALMRNHFSDLRAKSRRKIESQSQQERTEMKKIAAEAQGVSFGMEPRYDGNRIGLSPLLYWSKDNYQKLDGHYPH